MADPNGCSMAREPHTSYSYSQTWRLCGPPCSSRTGGGPILHLYLGNPYDIMTPNRKGNQSRAISPKAEQCGLTSLAIEALLAYAYFTSVVVGVTAEILFSPLGPLVAIVMVVQGLSAEDALVIGLATAKLVLCPTSVVAVGSHLTLAWIWRHRGAIASLAKVVPPAAYIARRSPLFLIRVVVASSTSVTWLLVGLTVWTSTQPMGGGLLWNQVAYGGPKTGRRWKRVNDDQGTTSQDAPAPPPTQNGRMPATSDGSRQWPVPIVEKKLGHFKYTEGNTTHHVKYYDSPSNYNCVVVATLLGIDGKWEWLRLALAASGVRSNSSGMTPMELEKVLERMEIGLDVVYMDETGELHTATLGDPNRVYDGKAKIWFLPRNAEQRLSFGSRSAMKRWRDDHAIAVVEHRMVRASAPKSSHVISSDPSAPTMVEVEPHMIPLPPVDADEVPLPPRDNSELEPHEIPLPDEEEMEDGAPDVNAPVYGPTLPTTMPVSEERHYVPFAREPPIVGLNGPSPMAPSRPHSALSSSTTDAARPPIPASASGGNGGSNGLLEILDGDDDIPGEEDLSSEGRDEESEERATQPGSDMEQIALRGMVSILELGKLVVTREDCPYIEAENGEVVLIDAPRDWASQEKFGKHRLDCGCVCTISTTVLGRPFGLGQRQWWYTGQPTAFFGCGPTRPDTLHEIPRHSWKSKMIFENPHTVFAPMSSEYRPTPLGLVREKHRTELEWSPVTKGRWTYAFHPTGRKTMIGGKVWEEFRSIKSAVPIVDHISFTRHVLPSFDCSTVTTTVQGREVYVRELTFPEKTFRLPLKLYEHARKVAMTMDDMQYTTSSLTNILTTSSQDFPGFLVESEEHPVWRDYFILRYGRVKNMMDKRTLHHRFSASSKSFGIAQPRRVRDDRQCTLCRLWAPRKYHWKHGLCQECSAQYNSGRNTTDVSRHYADSETPFSLNIGIHEPRQFVHLQPCEAREKVKPIRPAAKLDVPKEQLRGKVSGFSKPEKNRYNRTTPPVLVGIGLASKVGVFEANVDTEATALRTRLFAQPETGPRRGAFEELLDFGLKWELLGQPVTSPSKETFCHIEDWPAEWWKMAGFKERLNEYAVISGYEVDKHRDGVKGSWISTFPPGRRSQFWKALMKGCPSKITFSFFLKRELAVLACRWGRESRDRVNPRVICSPDDYSHILLGPRLRGLTRHLHTLWGTENWVTYAGGLTPQEMHMWSQDKFSPDCLRFAHPHTIAIENDFAKFDCTYTQPALDMVQKIYAHWGYDVLNGRESKLVWDGWGRPEGYMKSSGRRIRGPVMNASGRDDTALMNALLNGLIQGFAFASILLNRSDPQNATALEMAWVRRSVSLIVLGDDSLTLCPRFGIDGATWGEKEVGDIIARFGFEARDMAVRDMPCKCVFLGCRPYPALHPPLSPGEGWRLEPTWGPTIGRRIVRLGTLLDGAGKDPFAWLRGICKSASMSYPHVPYLNDIIARMDSLNLSRQTTPFQDKRDKHKRMMFLGKCVEARKECEEVIRQVYGLGPMHRCHFKSLLAQITTLPCIVVDPSVESMIAADA